MKKVKKNWIRILIALLAVYGIISAFVFPLTHWSAPAVAVGAVLLINGLANKHNRKKFFALGWPVKERPISY